MDLASRFDLFPGLCVEAVFVYDVGWPSIIDVIVASPNEDMIVKRRRDEFVHGFEICVRLYDIFFTIDGIDVDFSI